MATAAANTVSRRRTRTRGPNVTEPMPPGTRTDNSARRLMSTALQRMARLCYTHGAVFHAYVSMASGEEVILGSPQMRAALSDRSLGELRQAGHARRYADEYSVMPNGFDSIDIDVANHHALYRPADNSCAGMFAKRQRVRATSTPMRADDGGGDENNYDDDDDEADDGGGGGENDIAGDQKMWTDVANHFFNPLQLLDESEVLEQIVASGRIQGVADVDEPIVDVDGKGAQSNMPKADGRREAVAFDEALAAPAVAAVVLAPSPSEPPAVVLAEMAAHFLDGLTCLSM